MVRLFAFAHLGVQFLTSSHRELGLTAGGRYPARAMRLPATLAVLAALPLALVAACSSTEDRPAAIGASGGTPIGGNTSSGGGGDGGASADGGDSGATDGGACLPGTYDVDLVANGGGARGVAGKIVLPNVVDANRNGVLTIATDTSTLSQPLPFKTTKSLATLTYRISGLNPGKYVLRVQIDQVQTSAVDEIGDIDGFYGGSASAPVLTRQDALTFDLTNDCKAGADFGAGIKP